uniref:G_PROTEIN_RECEP_F1_2 domain-containing protein n=1 Tax=Panagrellus redivivus TaxID=6233 RepID=A0A7E4ZTT4_PANRE
MDNKYTITVIIIFIFLYQCGLSSAIYLATTDAETCRQLAVNETGGSLVKYFNESTFYYTGENGGTTRVFCYLGFVVIGIVLIPFAACIIVFIAHVIYKSKSINKTAQTARSLVLMVTVQAVLCISMVIFPVMWILAGWTWNLNHDVELTNYLIVLLSFHGIVDAFCTLYCVMPYRRFVLSLFQRKQKIIFHTASVTSARMGTSTL